MKLHLLALILLAAMPVAGVRAQSAPKPIGTIVVHFKNGTSVTSSGVRRSGANIAVTVQLGGAGRSESSYPADSIASIDFPKPAAIRTAEESLAKGNAAAALADISPVVNQQAAFGALPGNWLAKAVLLQIKALVALGRYDEAGKAIGVLPKDTAPADLLSARLQVALGWTKQGNPDKAQSVFDDAIATSKDDEAVATAWVGKGDAFLAAKDYDSALLSFLRVPIFYSQEKAALPPALLGSARAYLHIDEAEKAREILQKIVSTYPGSPSAEAAKTELKKLDGDTVKPS